MKKFQFALERVRQWREQQAEIEEERLGALLAERSRIQCEMTRWEAEKSDADKALVSFSILEASQLAALDQWRAHLGRERVRLDAWLADCGRRIAAQQQAVLEAQRRARLLERLKQRGFEQWRRGVDRDQDQLATEIHLATHFGRRRGEP
jgi:hypothetical protein